MRSLKAELNKGPLWTMEVVNKEEVGVDDAQTSRGGSLCRLWQFRVQVLELGNECQEAQEQRQ